MQWSANYYGNNWNRYQMGFPGISFFTFLTHPSVCVCVYTYVHAHSCLYLCVYGKVRHSTKLQEEFLHDELSFFTFPGWISPYGEKSWANYCSSKTHFFEHFGYKFGIIKGVGDRASSNNWTQERYDDSAVCNVSISLVSSLQPLCWMVRCDLHGLI